jgi:hypothetical protein
MMPFSRETPAMPAHRTWPFSDQPSHCPERQKGLYESGKPASQIALERDKPASKRKPPAKKTGGLCYQMKCKTVRLT